MEQYNGNSGLTFHILYTDETNLMCDKSTMYTMCMGCPMVIHMSSTYPVTRFTGDTYLLFLQETLPELLNVVLLDIRRHSWQQHDGMLAHRNHFM
ncbi:hypothetical protein PR048_011321 [Dryococelus australis]|uniref:Uncharacterized protein n=1 Tax=Dryococelus australis TaxID=614101 RepID=A0ABQ9HLG1_9NEOP|nr:hypothetical protein PR048_011321 [Dryococelus australis]